MKKFKLMALFLMLISITIIFAQTNTETNRILSSEILPREIRESIMQRMVVITTIQVVQGKMIKFYVQGILIQPNIVLTVRHLIDDSCVNQEITLCFLGNKSIKIGKKNITCHPNLDLIIIDLDALSATDKKKLPQVEPIIFSAVQPTELIFMPCYLLYLPKDSSQKRGWINLLFSGTIVNLFFSEGGYLYVDIPISSGVSGSGIFNKKGQLVGMSYAYFQINPEIKLALAIDGHQIEEFLKTTKSKKPRSD